MASNTFIVCCLLLLLTVNNSARVIKYAQSDYGDAVQLKNGGSNDQTTGNGQNNGQNSNIYPKLNNNDDGGNGGNNNYPQNDNNYPQNNNNNQDAYPQDGYVEPTRESRIKHIIKSAIKGAIMGAAASAAAAAMNNDNESLEQIPEDVTKSPWIYKNLLYFSQRVVFHCFFCC